MLSRSDKIRLAWLGTAHFYPAGLLAPRIINIITPHNEFITQSYLLD